MSAPQVRQQEEVVVGRLQPQFPVQMEKTVRYYGLEVVASICVDSVLRREDLERYDVLPDQISSPAAWRTLLRDALQCRLPPDWQYNRLFFSRKPEVETYL